MKLKNEKRKFELSQLLTDKITPTNDMRIDYNIIIVKDKNTFEFMIIYLLAFSNTGRFLAFDLEMPLSNISEGKILINTVFININNYI
jgi:hypothetical protein